MQSVEGTHWHTQETSACKTDECFLQDIVYNFSATVRLSQVKFCVNLPKDKSSLLNSKGIDLLCLNLFCCDYPVDKYTKVVFILNVTLIGKQSMCYTLKGQNIKTEILKKKKMKKKT